MRQIVAVAEIKRAEIAPGSCYELQSKKLIRLVANEFDSHQADFLLGVVVLA